MQRCDKCKLTFSGYYKKCPLCSGELTGDPEPAAFPRNRVKESGIVALSVLGFLTGAALLIMLCLGHLLQMQVSVVASACVALVANYLLVRNVIVHSVNFLRVIGRYFLALVFLALIWFLLTGNTIISTFVIPIICMVALVFDTVLLCVFRGTYVSRHAKYLVFDILLGLVPMALVIAGCTTWDVLAFVSALMASIFLLALLVFLRKELLQELHKMFSS